MYLSILGCFSIRASLKHGTSNAPTESEAIIDRSRNNPVSTGLRRTEFLPLDDWRVGVNRANATGSLLCDATWGGGQCLEYSTLVGPVRQDRCFLSCASLSFLIAYRLQLWVYYSTSHATIPAEFRKRIVSTTTVAVPALICSTM